VWRHPIAVLSVFLEQLHFWLAVVKEASSAPFAMGAQVACPNRTDPDKCGI
jgi:hypothetical protein